MEAVQTVLAAATVLVQMDFYKEKAMNNVRHVNSDSDLNRMNGLLMKSIAGEVNAIFLEVFVLDCVVEMAIAVHKIQIISI